MNTIEARILARLTRSGECWEWCGSTNRGAAHQYGYGIIRIGGRATGKLHAVHRVVYEMYCAPIPAGLDVLHSCDNPRCAKPTHLFVGTHTDNMKDKERKGRGNHPKGTQRENAKLTESQVIEILALRGTPQRELAARYGVSVPTICAIQTRRKWKHVVKRWF